MLNTPVNSWVCSCQHPLSLNVKGPVVQSPCSDLALGSSAFTEMPWALFVLLMPLQPLPEYRKEPSGPEHRGTARLHVPWNSSSLGWRSAQSL